MLRKSFLAWLPLVTCLLTSPLTHAAPPDNTPAVPPTLPLPEDPPAAHAERMRWWREASFGMFIHWGLYSIPAGTWKGQQTSYLGEWIMDRAFIPVPEYEALARQFNPTQYNPAEWARLAKQAGIEYIVITSKHHDGFSLYDSAVSDYNSVKATPYGRDLLAPLAKECRKQGIRFCLYYSIMDWHHPSQFPASDTRYSPTQMHPERKDEYLLYMRRQLRELITQYEPEVLWFDGEWPKWYLEDDGRALYTYLRNIKPSLIINNRIGKGRKGKQGFNKDDQRYVGDFGTPEQQIPATGLPGMDWESCMTMNDTWGFKSFDHNWKAPEALIREMIDTVSKGGNYLLNIGPTAEGLIPGPSVERLEAFGRWIKVNGQAIYGTQASPINLPEWGRCTWKLQKEGQSQLYLHVFDWPKDCVLKVKGLGVTPRNARLLANGANLKCGLVDGVIEIALPAAAPDPIASVIVLDLPRL